MTRVWIKIIGVDAAASAEVMEALRDAFGPRVSFKAAARSGRAVIGARVR